MIATTDRSTTDRADHQPTIDARFFLAVPRASAKDKRHAIGRVKTGTYNCANGARRGCKRRMLRRGDSCFEHGRKRRKLTPEDLRLLGLTGEGA